MGRHQPFGVWISRSASPYQQQWSSTPDAQGLTAEENNNNCSVHFYSFLLHCISLLQLLLALGAPLDERGLSLSTTLLSALTLNPRRLQLCSPSPVLFFLQGP